MGIDVPSYGIHGTTEPQSLGKQVTQGCVRMANPEVEELYTIVPLGTEVTIVD
jgi:lipoprotein-anchoring transpeptidase ErfK/SrfK